MKTHLSDTPPALNCLIAARLYFSAYLTPAVWGDEAKDRTTLVAAGGRVDSHLRFLQDHLLDSTRSVDLPYLRTTASATTYAFENFCSHVNEIWPDGLVDARGHDVCAELIECSGRSRSQLEALLNKLRGGVREVLLPRFAAAIALFNLFIDKLDLDLRPVGAGSIVRSLNFRPEERQAAVSILSYFTEVLASKYPGLDVGVRIEQHGPRISLVVETPCGEIERIEKELDQYGLVVTGRLSPEAYLADPAQAMMLRHKLELAQIEIRHTRDLLTSERASFTNRIDSLESNIGFLRSMLSKSEYEASATSATIRKLALRVTPTAEGQLMLLASLLEQQKGVNQVQIDEVVKNLKTHAPSVIDDLNELLLKGAVQGAAGNYLYAALTALQKML